MSTGKQVSLLGLNKNNFKIDLFASSLVNLKRWNSVLPIVADFRDYVIFSYRPNPKRVLWANIRKWVNFHLFFLISSQSIYLSNRLKVSVDYYFYHLLRKKINGLLVRIFETVSLFFHKSHTNPINANTI